MPFASSTELLAWLDQNLFVNPQQVQELGPVAAATPAVHDFCKEMLRRDWLTPYQVNQILKGNEAALVIGANRLQMRLGEGAMGQVFKAWNVRLGRMVAVKMLHADHILSPKAMERFRREAQTASQLDHPNIVLVRDADEANRCPYIVMELIDGADLARVIKQQGPLPLHAAVEYCRQAAMGLQHAYERGVVHRDIKPSNLFVTTGPDGGPLVKILDFGLAKFEREEDGEKILTQAGRLIGTVDFIAPEQAQDAHGADIRADIYSLGCTLFYLLTGKPPFAGADQLEKLTARLTSPPPRLSEHLPGTPPLLDDVFARMMARNPADRFQTPFALVQALSTCLVPQSYATPAAPMPVPVVEPTYVVPEPYLAPPESAQPIDDAPGWSPMAPDTVAPVGGASPALPWDEPPARTSAAPAGERADSRDRVRSGLGMVAKFGVASVFLALVGGIVWFLFLRGDVAPDVKLGDIKVSLDSPPTLWKFGQRKPIIVVIERTGFKGPVTVTMEGLPAGLRMRKDEPIVIEDGKDKGQIDLTAGWEDPFDGSVKIVATSPHANRGECLMPLKVER